MRRSLTWLAALVLLAASGAACYYSPQTKKGKADPSFISEVDAEKLVQEKLAPYGIKFINNMKLRRDSVEFEADGYDRDLRIGFEYMSHEGGDFKGEPGQNNDGLSKQDIEALQQRQSTSREYFLIIPEGKREEVERVIDAFVEDLYKWEVLKKKGETKKDDGLFPEQNKKKDDLLPWEVTGDAKKKRQEMESKEKTGVHSGDKGSSDWGSDEGKETSGEDNTPTAKEPNKKDSKKGETKAKGKEESPKKGKAEKKDDFGDDEGGDVDF